MTTKSIEDVYTYAKQAYDLIPDDHPHSEEIKQLLIDQVNEELHDYDATSVPYRRTNSARKGSD